MAVLIQLQFDVGSADQAQAAVRAVHQEVARLNLATGTGVSNTNNFRAAVTQTATAARLGGENMHLLRGALISLAQQGTGTTGVMGRLAAGLLQFGAGSAIMVGVAAGIAALGLAYRAFTRDTENATKAQQEFVKELGKVSPFAAQRAKIFEATSQLSELILRRGRVAAPETLAEQKEFSPEGRVAALQDIDSQIAKLRTELVQGRKDLAQDIAAKLKPVIDLPTWARQAAGSFIFTPGIREAGQVGLRGAITMTRAGGNVFFPGRQPEEATGGVRPQGNLPPNPREITPIVAATFAAIASLAGGGGVGGAIGGLGGILSSFGLGLPGAIVSGFGALFGLFGGGGMPVKVTNFRDLEGIQQPSRTELLIVDSSGRPIERIMYDIGRRDRRDVEPRLPVTVGA